MTDRDPGLLPDLAEALAGAVPSDDDRCPGVEVLVEYMDGTLANGARAAVVGHVARCSICAALALELAEVWAPVRALHRGWGGWWGPALAGMDRLGKEGALLDAYHEHLARCLHCRHRAAIVARLRAVLGAVLGRPHPAVRAALVGAAALALFVYPGLLRSAGQRGPTGGSFRLKFDSPPPSGSRYPVPSEPDISRMPAEQPGRQGAVAPATGQKAGTTGVRRSAPGHIGVRGGLGPELSAGEVEALVRQLTRPTASRDRERAIAFWQRLSADEPDDAVALAALAELYGDSARVDLAHREAWLREQARTRSELERLLQEASGTK